MTTPSIGGLVDQKSHDLLARSESYTWIACAMIWARVFVLGVSGWQRWPEYLDLVQQAFPLAMLRSAEAGLSSPPEALLARLRDFNIEDDGSAEWQFVIDLIVMLTAALEGQDAAVVLRTTLRTYLEGMVNVLHNAYPEAAGGVISVAAARELLAADPEWARIVEFIRAL